MSLEYTGIPYFPLTSNFFEEDVPELLEAKFGDQSFIPVNQTALQNLQRRILHHLR